MLIGEKENSYKFSLCLRGIRKLENKLVLDNKATQKWGER